MTPLLNPIYEYTNGSDGIVRMDSNGYALIQSMDASIGPDYTNRYGNLDKGTYADIEKFCNFYRGNTNYPQPKQLNNTAEDIVTILSKFDSEISELKGAAETRPLCRYPVHYTSYPWSDMLPHLADMKRITVLCNTRAITLLELGKSQKAMDELKLAFRLSDSLKNEPRIVDHLIRITILGYDIQTVREGLYRHVWTEDQLLEIEKNLLAVNLLPEAKHVMNGERASIITGLEMSMKNKNELAATDIFVEIGVPPMFKTILKFSPCVMYQNMIALSKTYQNLVDGIDENKHLILVGDCKYSFIKLEQSKITPYNVFVKMFLPSLDSVYRKTGRMQTYVDSCRVSCAIERYWMNNKQLPNELKDLVPKFITKVPTDVIDGKEIRYSQTTNGYVLYSIGWNETDDCGTVGYYKNNSNNSVESSKGDWVFSVISQK